ncbi:MAG: hypothetical protein LBK53_04150 [Heliobacteriaceae bacterium]|jgi:hypothetical protein|nr:hypothetical protein [Heliobacteriaceae bacterium]
MQNDFVTFSGKLLRTPENFYEQPFNQKGMPDTMKEFLAQDENNKKIPPAQVLGIIFKPIEDAKTLDDVKNSIPNEPLFQNLVSSPTIESRKGILAEISLFKDDDKVSLFKNGNNDLGIYILKKIYLEGKTLNEINADFKKDISVVFKDLSPITDSAVYAYGIRRPDNAFWHSFLATRNDYEYVSLSRKQQEDLVKARLGKSAPKEQIIPPPPKRVVDNIPDWQLDKIADNMVNKVSRKKTSDKVKVNEETDNFINAYWSPIMFIAAHRADLARDMSNYFHNAKIDIDFDNLSDKTPLQNFWDNNPRMRTKLSESVKGTIKEFTDKYTQDSNGIIGRSEEFIALLNEAGRIKDENAYYRNLPEKELKEFQAIHDIKQRKYECLLEENNIVEESEPAVEESKTLTQEDVSDMVHDAAKKEGADVYRIETDNGIVYIIANTKELYKDISNQQTAFYPTSFKNKGLSFSQAHPLFSKDYVMTIAVHNSIGDRNIISDESGILKNLLSSEEANNISDNIMKDFINKYPHEDRAARRVIAEYIFDNVDKNGSKNFNYNVAILPGYIISLQGKLNHNVDEIEEAYRYADNEPFAMFKLQTYNLAGLSKIASLVAGDDISKENLDKLNKKYAEYCKSDFTKDEKKRIANYIMEYLKNYEQEKFPIDSYGVLEIISDNVKAHRGNCRQSLKNCILSSDLLKKYGGAARALLNDSYPEAFKTVMASEIVDNMFKSNGSNGRLLYEMIYCAPDDVIRKIMQAYGNETVSTMLQNKRLLEMQYKKTGV